MNSHKWLSYRYHAIVSSALQVCRYSTLEIRPQPRYEILDQRLNYLAHVLAWHLVVPTSTRIPQYQNLYPSFKNKGLRHKLRLTKSKKNKACIPKIYSIHRVLKESNGSLPPSATPCGNTSRLDWGELIKSQSCAVSPESVYWLSRAASPLCETPFIYFMLSWGDVHAAGHGSPCFFLNFFPFTMLP